ncbi:hypothetical protein PWT90_10886 [Aphanocladium album]|nr:hypothetical protein PWT90_10886 [Aphanocladium album]
MDSLSSGTVADVLVKLHQESYVADAPLQSEGHSEADGQWLAKFLESERNDLKGTYRGFAENFLCVSPKFGRHLYMLARASKAKCIVEFGTSMGVSAIYLAAALRDNGGGRLICTELEESKAERAKANIAAAGLSDLVDIRVGDARETLASGLGGKIDMVLLDGAWSLYRQVLTLLEPHLNPGTVVVADNATDTPGGYIEYVRDPSNGYVSMPLLDKSRGNELTIRTK